MSRAIADRAKARADITTNEEKEANHYTVINREGNNADYLTARIARDRPDLLKRVKAGEFHRVRQGALAAGLRPRQLQVLSLW